MSKSLNTIVFFKEIANIPRESGNEKEIAIYLEEFAKERNLFYKKDKYNNILIKKKTCNKKPIILQAHMDMVCEKEDAKQFNFATEGIEVIEKDGYLMANGTTLGADNGIGVAQILAILDSDILCNVEAIFTVEEETTMIGAIEFDVSDLEGRELLSLDGFEENVIIKESACFYDIILGMKYSFKETHMEKAYEINIKGMVGGHSGFDIDSKRGNSNIELAKILNRIDDIEIIDFIGGTKFNVIPSQAKVQFYTNLSVEKINMLCKKMQSELKKQYSNIKVSYDLIKTEKKALDNIQSKEFLKTIIEFPHGTINKNSEQEVTTSVNLAVVDLEKKEMQVGMRSSKKVEEKECVEMLKKYSNEKQLDFIILSWQPGFESDENSQLIQKLLQSHPADRFKEKPALKTVHITLETGFFQSKIPELQIAVISPNIQNAHAVSEKVEIESIARTDEWLVSFLSSY